ncbi:unnamed protein product [Phytophthora fragariaefolia]|uniref:Unnamed protein product n=1 Tax=Phytophthora fragariaefolia TaxID=1490495 RepID=A0A9W6XSJ8_9STRA|nr:unnamed protein product [Phytophthora fragariaefolia]
MGVDLPAGLTRDYDMLQLLEDDGDDASVAPTVPAPHSTRNSRAESPTSDGTSLSSSSPVESLNLGEFLLEDELFLQGMEESNDAINADALPDLDLDMMLPLSPAASSWLKTLEDSPGQTDGEVESPLLLQRYKRKEVVSPLRLDSSSSGHTEEEEEAAITEEMELLKREEKYLTAQKEFLEYKGKSPPRWKSVKSRRGRNAAKQTTLLLKSQEENQLLNGFVTQQKMYADNFKAMLAFAPVNDVQRMSLMTPLESYIRLGKDLNERRRTIVSLRKEKLDMTYKFIELKTLGMDFNKPHGFSDMFDKFGKHYCVNFTISRYDGVSIYQVARGIYNQLTEKDETLNEAIGINAQRETGNKFVKMPDLESNGIFYCRFGENSAVLATDYVDHDELYPYESSRIRKDMSNGVVLSAHEDTDGKKYVVVKRYTMAKLHMHPHKISQKQQDRFFLSMFHSHDSMKRLAVDRVLQRSDTGCSCTGNIMSCCCASDEASIPCGGYAHAQVTV